MKHSLITTITLTFVLMMTGCAPRTNHKNTTVSPEPTPYAVYESFTLYFPNTQNNKLIAENHELRINDQISREKLILDTLKMGPKNDELSSPLSIDAKIHSIKTISGLCTIDISGEFLNTNDNDHETAKLMLHAIVNSLCELETIQEVKFNIDGNTTAKINDSLDLSQPITPDIANI